MSTCSPPSTWACPVARSSSATSCPNLSSLLIIDATINVSTAILTEAGLSFFGFGVQPPDVSLGTLLSDGQNDASTYPWLFLFPSGFLVLLVLAVNLVGDGLRDALDPSSGKAQ